MKCFKVRAYGSVGLVGAGSASEARGIVCRDITNCVPVKFTDIRARRYKQGDRLAQKLGAGQITIIDGRLSPSEKEELRNMNKNLAW